MAAKKASKARTVARRKAPARGGTVVNIKRAYDPPSGDDGLRILIDRLWPRGMPKGKLRLELMGEASVAEQ